MITLNFNKSEVNFRKHPKLQTNLKLKRNYIFFHLICIYRTMQIKVICILLSVSFMTKGLIENFIPVWPRRINYL